MRFRLKSHQSWVCKRGDTALIICPRVASESIRASLGFNDRPKPRDWVQDKKASDGRTVIEFDAERVAYFVRNPFDRVISQYHLHLYPDYNSGGFGGPGISFDTFVERLCEIDTPDRHWWGQSEYYSTDEGLILPDFLGKLEKMDQDWPRFLEWSGWQAAPLEHKHKSRKFDSYYTPRSRKMVAERFAADFRNYGYYPEG